MKVLINVKRTTEYASIVEMSQEEYDKLQADLEAGGQREKEAEKILNRKIDTNDWQDDEFESLEEFKPVTD